MGNSAIDRAEMAGTAASAIGTAAEKTSGSDEPQSITETGSTESSHRPPPETPVHAATPSTPDMKPNDAGADMSPIEIVDECLVVDICIDRYLWALYQRAPKEDTIKVEERQNKDCYQKLYPARL
jgi:hypothetical protein